MPLKTHHVVPDPEGGWNVRKGGSDRVSDHFDNKQDAIDRAREISQNQNTELVIHNKDGQISRHVNSFNIRARYPDYKFDFYQLCTPRIHLSTI